MTVRLKPTINAFSEQFVMKGFVPTPESLVDLMVAKLFLKRQPQRKDTLLDPGCGRGALIDGVIRWCKKRDIPLPRIIGIESDPKLIAQTKERFSDVPSVTIQERDFLTSANSEYDFIIGNPPYVSITKLSEQERLTFRKQYTTAKGRFDLYLLFFERALNSLSPKGRLVFITPEKFLYVETAQPLRSMLAKFAIEEIHLVNEDVFGGLATYPTITTVVSTPIHGSTKVTLRDGTTRDVLLSGYTSSWMPGINGSTDDITSHTLKDICVRISCGIATGADAVYVVKTIGPELERFAYPTIAGQEIRPNDGALKPNHFMLMPYSQDGELLPERELGELGAYLNQPERRGKLLKRTCAVRKPWYAFHETPPLPEILRPKILCKDITRNSFFIVDETGALVPRHSVYYIVPKDPSHIHEIANYLNSPTSKFWLASHCQRATNNFLRLQSHVLKQLPIPGEFVAENALLTAPAEKISA